MKTLLTIKRLLPLFMILVLSTLITSAQDAPTDSRLSTSRANPGDRVTINTGIPNLICTLIAVDSNDISLGTTGRDGSLDFLVPESTEEKNIVLCADSEDEDKMSQYTLDILFIPQPEPINTTETGELIQNPVRITSLSRSTGSSSETLQINTNTPNLPCGILNPKIESEYSNTDENGSLDLIIPDVGIGDYLILCTDEGRDDTENTLYDFILFRVVEPQPGSPERYFQTVSPDSLIPLSDQIDLDDPETITAEGERFVTEISLTNTQNETLQLNLSSNDESALEDYLREAKIHFNVVALPVSYQVETNTGELDTACPIPPMMAVGARGRVLPDPPTPNILRSSATNLVWNITGRIAAGSEFEVLEGPVCNNHINWWRVRSDSGKEDWTAEGADGQYFTETYADIDVVLSVEADDASYRRTLFFYIDPSISQGIIHRYRSTREHSASIRARVTGGEVSLTMYRSNPNGGYIGTSRASSGNSTSWLSHSSGTISAEYSARVIGKDQRSQYTIQGSFVLK